MPENKCFKGRLVIEVPAINLTTAGKKKFGLFHFSTIY